MISSLDTHAEQLGQKFSQQIIFADDEISSLKEFLQTLKNEHAEIRGQIEYIKHQQNLTENNLKNQDTTTDIRKKAKYYDEKITHQNTLKRLDIEHAATIRSMTEDFEILLGQIWNWSDKITAQKVAPLERDIKKARKMLHYMETMSPSKRKMFSVVDTDDDLIEKTNMDQETYIHKLESKVDEKNRQRLKELVFVKGQLSHCIEKLEKLNKTHSQEMNRARNLLARKTSTYERKLSDYKERKQYELQNLREKVAEHEEILRKQEVLFQKMTSRFQEKMYQIQQRGDQKRFEISAMMSTPTTPRTNAKMIDMRNKVSTELIKLQHEIDNKKQILANAYEENTALKREINKRKMESLLDKRKKAL